MLPALTEDVLTPTAAPAVPLWPVPPKPSQGLRSDAQERADMQAQYRAVRAESLRRSQHLSAEDQCIQSMPDASPCKWHLAHSTWFFETVVLKALQPGYAVFNPRFHYLFNSYYEALGPRHARPQRGLLSRPSLAEVQAYRAHVDAAMQGFIAHSDAPTWQQAQGLLRLGFAHEQQHQELLLTDMLHALWSNPLLPAFWPPAPVQAPVQAPLQVPLQVQGPSDLPAPGSAAQASQLPAPAAALLWLEHPGGIVQVGWRNSAAQFVFDNEGPRHAALLRPFAMASRLVNCGEFAAFVADGGYRRPELWLSDGWALVQTQHWQAPAYWLAPGDARAPADHWQVFGLQGVQALVPEAPVSQLSFYEAAAYAAWAGARLPTEFEWEAASSLSGMDELYASAWQWTRSSYDPYPGFAPMAGDVAEYNGKFMVGQMVLRGGSVATPAGHTRPSYRNFFAPAARWQFSGLRLAKDIHL